jgi:hypothetical protein
MVMGVGESIEKAAENAMKDLSGTAERTDDGHVPDPGDPNDNVEVHSSLSEGSNTMEAEKEREGRDAGPKVDPSGMTRD